MKFNRGDKVYIDIWKAKAVVRLCHPNQLNYEVELVTDLAKPDRRVIHESWLRSAIEYFDGVLTGEIK